MSIHFREEKQHFVQLDGFSFQKSFNFYFIFSISKILSGLGFFGSTAIHLELIGQCL